MATIKKPTKTPAAEAAPPATATYTVRSPVRHDGQRYEIDESVELTEAQAARLGGKVEKAAATATASANEEPAQ